MSETITRSVDLTEAGADALYDFIGEFHANEGKSQAYLEIELDDGTIIDKAVIVAETFDGDTIYRLRLSGL